MAVPDLIGWILIASSQNLAMILSGRFLSGFSAAGYSPSIQVFRKSGVKSPKCRKEALRAAALNDANDVTAGFEGQGDRFKF